MNKQNIYRSIAAVIAAGTVLAGGISLHTEATADSSSFLLWNRCDATAISAKVANLGKRVTTSEESVESLLNRVESLESKTEELQEKIEDSSFENFTPRVLEATVTMEDGKIKVSITDGVDYMVFYTNSITVTCLGGHVTTQKKHDETYVAGKRYANLYEATTTEEGAGIAVYAVPMPGGGYTFYDYNPNTADVSGEYANWNNQ